MKNGLFTFDMNSWIKGIALAIITSIIVLLARVVLVDHFDVFTVDWVSVGKDALNTSIVAFVAYIVKNFISTDRGSVLGITPNDKV